MPKKPTNDYLLLFRGGALGDALFQLRIERLQGELSAAPLRVFNRQLPAGLGQLDKHANLRAQDVRVDRFDKVIDPARAVAAAA